MLQLKKPTKTEEEPSEVQPEKGGAAEPDLGEIPEQDNCSFCGQEGNRGSRPWGRQDPSSHWPLSQRELQLSGKALPPLTAHRRSDSSEAQNGSGVLPDPS